MSTVNRVSAALGAALVLGVFVAVAVGSGSAAAEHCFLDPTQYVTEPFEGCTLVGDPIGTQSPAEDASVGPGPALLA